MHPDYKKERSRYREVPLHQASIRERGNRPTQVSRYDQDAGIRNCE